MLCDVADAVAVIALVSGFADAFLLRVTRRCEVDEFDALADVDELGVGPVVTQGLNRPVRPRLEPRADVDEGVGPDDVTRDGGVWLPAVAAESGRDEVLHR